MKLSEIKKKLVISRLELNTANDTDGNPTEWLRHWDNDNRVAVSLHKDLFEELKKDGDKIDSLGLQHETRTGDKGDYESYRIIKYKPAEFTL